MKQTAALWKIEWHDGLNTGLQEVDSQHQRFVAIVNQLNQAIRSRRDRAELERLVEALILDAHDHFEHEERVFMEVGYPGAAEHMKEHTRLLNQLVRLSSEMRHMPFGQLWVEYGLQVKQLLVEHLMNQDLQYRAFAEADGV